MKVEMDEIYCCGQEMDRKVVIDLDLKRSCVILMCNCCEISYSFNEKVMLFTELNRKTPYRGHEFVR